MPSDEEKRLAREAQRAFGMKYTEALRYVTTSRSTEAYKYAPYRHVMGEGVDNFANAAWALPIPPRFDTAGAWTPVPWPAEALDEFPVLRSIDIATPRQVARFVDPIQAAFAEAGLDDREWNGGPVAGFRQNLSVLPAAGVMGQVERYAMHNAPGSIDAWDLLSALNLAVGTGDLPGPHTGVGVMHPLTAAHAFAETAVEVGQRALEALPGLPVVPFSEPSNRGFLSALKRTAMLGYQLGEASHATRAAINLLILDPTDPLKARYLWRDLTDLVSFAEAVEFDPADVYVDEWWA